MSVFVRTIVLGVALALALAACGDDPEPAADDTSTAPADEPADEPADDAAAADAAAADAHVATASTDLGTVLVDGDGLTLYLFEPDEQSASTCYDDCATSWPPLLADGDPQAGDGVDAALLGTAERTDGTTQITYDGWPLYHWAGDDAPGDTNGQGIGDVWWAMSPDGSPVRDAAAADDGGY